MRKSIFFWMNLGYNCINLVHLPYHVFASLDGASSLGRSPVWFGFNPGGRSVRGGGLWCPHFAGVVSLQCINRLAHPDLPAARAGQSTTAHISSIRKSEKKTTAGREHHGRLPPLFATFERSCPFPGSPSLHHAHCPLEAERDLGSGSSAVS